MSISEINKSSTMPSSIVPGEFDVIIGVGRASLRHSGNMRLKHLVQSQAHAFLHADKETKTKMITQVVNQILESGGSFVKEESDGVWVQEDVKKSYTRVSTYFGRAKQKQERMEQQRQLTATAASVLPPFGSGSAEDGAVAEVPPSWATLSENLSVASDPPSGTTLKENVAADPALLESPQDSLTPYNGMQMKSGTFSSGAGFSNSNPQAKHSSVDGLLMGSLSRPHGQASAEAQTKATRTNSGFPSLVSPPQARNHAYTLAYSGASPAPLKHKHQQQIPGVTNLASDDHNYNLQQQIQFWEHSSRRKDQLIANLQHTLAWYQDQVAIRNAWGHGMQAENARLVAELKAAQTKQMQKIQPEAPASATSPTKAAATAEIVTSATKTAIV